MKELVCVDNKGFEAFLVVGDIYLPYTEDSIIRGNIIIYDKKSRLSIRKADRFVSIEEYRNLVINNILEEKDATS